MRRPNRPDLTFLKVKIKSLAAEAKIIRLEERRAKASGQTGKLQSLHLHRILVVRKQARYALLARAFLRGVPYVAVEQPCDLFRWRNLGPILVREIGANVKRFAHEDRQNAIEEWLKAA